MFFLLLLPLNSDGPVVKYVDKIWEMCELPFLVFWFLSMTLTQQ